MQKEEEYSKMELDDENGGASSEDIDGNSASSKDVDRKPIESIEPD